MLSSTIVLKDASGVDHNFVQIDTTSNGGGIVRVDSSSPRSEPNRLQYRHQPAGKANDVGQRHTLTLTKALKGSDGNIRNMAINISLTVPAHESFTDSFVLNQLHMAFDGFVETGPFTIDAGHLGSVLMGES